MQVEPGFVVVNFRATGVHIEARLEGVATRFGVKTSDSHGVQEGDYGGFDFLLCVGREGIGDSLNEVDHLFILPDGTDHLKDVICDQSGKLF